MLLEREEVPPTEDHRVGLYLGSYGGPRGVAVSYERGTPVRPYLVPLSSGWCYFLPDMRFYDQYTRNVGNTSMLLEREEEHSSGRLRMSLLYHSA
jgi:hypothetical protein